jgi:hypothetical protein
MYDSTTVRTKKKILMINELGSRFTDTYTNSKSNNVREFKKKKKFCVAIEKSFYLDENRRTRE